MTGWGTGATLLAALILAGGAPASARQATRAAPPAGKALEPGVKGGVIKPPAGVDRGIKAPVPAPQHFPMPVIKPPAPRAQGPRR
jgi:hypothetical protein